MLEWPLPKDPGSDLLYSAEVDDLRDGEVVDSDSWTVPEGVVGTPQAVTDDEIFIRISGGIDGVDYVFTVDIVTNLGNTIQRDIKLKVRNR